MTASSSPNVLSNYGVGGHISYTLSFATPLLSASFDRVALSAISHPSWQAVAYDAGIINAAFYTTLVLMAVLTSQAAGAWLEYVLRKGWPLLSGSDAEEPATVVEEMPRAA